MPSTDPAGCRIPPITILWRIISKPLSGPMGFNVPISGPSSTAICSLFHSGSDQVKLLIFNKYIPIKRRSIRPPFLEPKTTSEEVSSSHNSKAPSVPITSRPVSLFPVFPSHPVRRLRPHNDTPRPLWPALAVTFLQRFFYPSLKTRYPHPKETFLGLRMRF